MTKIDTVIFILVTIGLLSEVKKIFERTADIDLSPNHTTVLTYCLNTV